LSVRTRAWVHRRGSKGSGSRGPWPNYISVADLSSTDSQDPG
jgi:hypothetical protein